MTVGPGGREIARLSVRVVPDVSRFREDLRAELAKVEASARTAVTVGTKVDATNLRRQVDQAVTAASATAKNVKIKASVDSSQLSEFSNAVKAVDKSLSRNGGSGGGNGRLALYGGLGTAAAVALPHILGLAGSLEQVAGATALIPSVAFAAGAGVATLVVGIEGMKKALNAKTQADPSKYAAALANLAPSARSAVLALGSLSTQLHGLRLSVQQSLFAGMSTEIQRLGVTLIPVFKSGLTGIAGQLNLAAKAFAGFATSAGTVTDLKSTFANITQAFHNLVPAVQPFLQALRDIGTVGSSFLPGLATSVSNVANKFASFAANARATGQLRGWIQGGIDAIKQLGSVLGSSLRILQSFITAAQSVGGGVLAGLASVLKKVADVVSGPVFQKGLKDFFGGLNAGFASLGSAMPALGSALAALGPPLAALATGIGKVLADAIRAITPAIISMAPALTDLIKSLTSLTSGALQFLGPLLTDIAKAASGIVQNVPGATVAITALLVALGGKAAIGALGFGKSLDKVTTSVKDLVRNSSGLTALKVGFAAKDVSVAGAFAGNLGRIGAVASKTGITVDGLKTAFKGLGVAGIVVGGIAFGIQQNLERLKNAHDNASEAANKLKASFDSEKLSMVEFAAANANAIKQLREGSNGKAFLIQIGFDLVQNGKTPQQAFDQVKRLADTAGIKLPINFTFNTLSDPKAQLQAISDSAKELTKQIRLAGGGVSRFGTQLDGIGVVGTKTAEDLQAIGKSAFDAFNANNFAGGVAQLSAFEAAVKATNEPLGKQKAAINEVSDAFLRSFGPSLGVSTKNASDLSTALDELARSATAPQGLKDFIAALKEGATPAGHLSSTLDFLGAAVLPKVKTKAQSVTEEFLRQSGVVAAANRQYLAQKEAIRAVIAGLDALDAAITKSIGGNISLKKSQADTIDAAIALGKSIKANGTSFDITSAKGRLNIAAMDSLATQFAATAKATIQFAKDHHGSLFQAGQDVLRLRGQLIAQAIQAGLSRKEALKLADAYLKLPKSIVTIPKFDAKAALKKSQDYGKAIIAQLNQIGANAAKSGYTAGSDYAQGLAKGIDANSFAATVAGRAIGLAAYNATRGVLLIHSPSRLMAQVGTDFVAGFAVGIQNGTAVATAAAKATAAQITAAFRAALGVITESLKTQPTSVDGLRAAYLTVRNALHDTLPAYAQTAQAYVLQKEKTAALREELRRFSSAQTVHNAATRDGVAQARAYLQAQLDTAKAHHASKKVIADLTEKLRLLSRANSTNAADTKAAAAVLKAALQDQIAASVTLGQKAKDAADKAKQAYQDAIQNAKDAAAALIGVVQAQADALVAEIQNFRSNMTDQIKGGVIDFAAAWGATTDSAGVFVPGTVAQLKQALDDRLKSVQQFAADLKALAAAGASQDVISQIAGLGPGQGDILAQQLLASGPESVKAINDVLQQIQDAAGKGAEDLTKQFYQPGVDAVTALIKGMQKQFPELRLALQEIVDLVNATLSGITGAVASVTSIAPNVPTQRNPSAHQLHVAAAAHKAHLANTNSAGALDPTAISAPIVAAIQQGTASTNATITGQSAVAVAQKRSGAS